MYKKLENRLIRIAERYGWGHSSTLSEYRIAEKCRWEHSSTPACCTYWFRLKDASNIMIALKWDRDKPNVLTTINGVLPNGTYVSGTKINLDYVSSFQQLVNFFKITAEKAEEKAPQTFFAKLGEYFKR